jgi:hypothetical protein
MQLEHLRMADSSVSRGMDLPIENELGGHLSFYSSLAFVNCKEQRSELVRESSSVVIGR